MTKSCGLENRNRVTVTVVVAGWRDNLLHGDYKPNDGPQENLQHFEGRSRMQLYSKKPFRQNDGFWCVETGNEFRILHMLSAARSDSLKGTRKTSPPYHYYHSNKLLSSRACIAFDSPSEVGNLPEVGSFAVSWSNFQISRPART